MIVRMKRLFFIVYLILLTSRSLYALPHDKDDYILVVHSINFSEVWTQGIYEAINNTFAEESISVKGEELSIPAMRDTTDVNKKVELLRKKYPVPPKVIVCIGDPAWLVCQPLFDKEWKNVSTIICHSQELIPTQIEYLLDRDLQTIQHMAHTENQIKSYNATRLVQPLYIKETIETIKKLQPELNRIVFIRDNRYISLYTQKELSKTMQADFPDLKLEVLSTPALSTENLLDSLSLCGKETGIIYYSWFIFKNTHENHYLIDNVQKMTNSFSQPPVYILADLNIETGNFAGGHYISENDFSKSVIATVRLILEGTEARNILTHIGGTAHTHLNYQHLLSHSIEPSHFPINAIYYQQPPTFFQKYKIHLFSGFAIICLLITIAVLRFRLYFQKLKREEERREKEKAEEANRLKSAFLANMSHEIRTPLNAIVGFSNLIAHSESPEDTAEFCQIIETNNELLLQLINDILDLSKIEADQLEFTFTNIDVSALLATLAQTFKSRTKQGVILEYSIPEQPCFIYSEKTRLTQVITNFLTNACKFTMEGSIKMGYEETTDGLRFYVTDTGKGISDENIPHVFERFAKFDNFIQGTGLGLSICMTIVKRLNGEIGVESKEGKGSTFWFTIPCEVLHENTVTSESVQ